MDFFGGALYGAQLSAEAIARGDKAKVFDWHKAVELIKQHNITNATAGLLGDMSYTAGEILAKGKPVTDSYTYLSSLWATPILVDDDTGKEYECWDREDKLPEKWDSGTKWPESAVKMLKGE